ncbi:MAG: GCN5-related N-acetyltransferase [Frankiales bacterium]|nr:GCN5-related N-acetyltransferase [Frankiales bacterium]
MSAQPRTVFSVEPLLEIYRAAQAARGRRPSAERLARVREKLDEGLVVVDDELRGFALGEPGREDDGSGEPVAGLLHLSMVFVHPDAQRHGLGLQLVEALADEAWDLGYRRVSVWSATPEFYEACGLERTGRTQQVQAGTAFQLVADLEAPLREVVVNDDAIRLGQLLKLAELVETGSEAKELLATGAVEVNGEQEVRRGRQLQDGDEVRVADRAVLVRLSPSDA